MRRLKKRLKKRVKKMDQTIPTTHTAAEGDTIKSVAGLYGVDPGELALLAWGDAPLTPGTVFQLPAQKGGQDVPVSDPTAEKKTDEVPAPAVPASEVHIPKNQVDPSFNCVPCQGEGLLNETTICPDCKGTGKV